MLRRMLHILGNPWQPLGSQARPAAIPRPVHRIAGSYSTAVQTAKVMAEAPRRSLVEDVADYGATDTKATEKQWKTNAKQVKTS